MARVVVTETATRELDALIATRNLPASTRDRIRGHLTPLHTYPLLGRELVGRWAGFRVLLGPWPWMLLVYRYDEPRDEVAVVTIQDSRTAAAVTRSVP